RLSARPRWRGAARRRSHGRTRRRLARPSLPRDRFRHYHAPALIVVANLRLSGFFRLVSNWVVARARHPLVLLLAIVLVSGAFSAFLVNDTICLVMTPLVLDLATRLKRDPIPYLLAIPMAYNVVST